MSDAPPRLMVRGLHHLAWPVALADDAADGYCSAKGFRRIDRPDLGFPGAWIQKGRLILHLLEVEPIEPAYFDFWHTAESTQISISVHDLFASIAFYTNVLGLAIVEKEEMDRHPPSLFRVPIEESMSALLVTTGVSLYLLGSGFRRPPTKPNSRGSHIAFGVENIDAAEAWLEHCGVTYVRKTQRGSGIEQIFLVDPDGHTLELNPSPMP